MNKENAERNLIHQSHQCNYPDPDSCPQYHEGTGTCKNPAIRCSWRDNEKKTA